MKISKRTLGLAVCLTATGCEFNSGNTIVLPIQQGAGQTSHMRLHFVALAGRQSRLRTAFFLNPDCSPAGVVSFRLLAAPAHGTAAIEQGLYYPEFPAGSIRAACDLQRRVGIALSYIPAPGFIGADHLTLLVVRPDGTELIIDYSLEVN